MISISRTPMANLPRAHSLRAAIGQLGVDGSDAVRLFSSAIFPDGKLCARQQLPGQSRDYLSDGLKALKSFVSFVSVLDHGSNHDRRSSQGVVTARQEFSHE